MNYYDLAVDQGIRGVLEQNNYVIKLRARLNRFCVDFEMIADYVNDAIDSNLDCHVLFGGANGIGKSYGQLILAKVLMRKRGMIQDFKAAAEANQLRFFYNYHKREDLKKAIIDCQKCVFVIDELRPFFDHKQSMTKKQTELYNCIEIARKRNHIYIGASRDYLKLDKTYRNAKAQLLVYIYDKIVDRTIKDNEGHFKTVATYGEVFVGNTMLEGEDKFNFAFMRGFSMSDTMHQAEENNTYVGVITIDDVKQYGLSDEDISIYEFEKEKGVKAEGLTGLDDRILSLRQNGKTYREISKELKLAPTTIHSKMKAYRERKLKESTSIVSVNRTN